MNLLKRAGGSGMSCIVLLFARSRVVSGFLRERAADSHASRFFDRSGSGFGIGVEFLCFARRICLLCAFVVYKFKASFGKSYFHFVSSNSPLY
jgi:hypothetical protein